MRVRAGFALAAFTLGPCLALGQEPLRPTRLIGFLEGVFETSQLLDTAEDCSVRRRTGEASGRLLAFDNGEYTFEGYGCTLRPGAALRVECGGGTVDGITLPKMLVRSFVIDSEHVQVAGTMTIDEWSYCFTLDAPLHK